MKHNLLIILRHSEQGRRTPLGWIEDDDPLQHRCTVENFTLTEVEGCMTDFKIGTAVEYWENFLGHDDFKLGEDDADGYVEYVGELMIFNPTAFYVDPDTGEYVCIPFDSDTFECYVKRETRK